MAETEVAEDMVVAWCGFESFNLCPRHRQPMPREHLGKFCPKCGKVRQLPEEVADG